VRIAIEAQKKFVDKLVELTNIVKRVHSSDKVGSIDSNEFLIFILI
jgi:hypothetical protein